MKRIGAMVAAAALIAAPLHAQDVDRKVPAFELGFYGGGAWTSDWLGINDEFLGFDAGFDDNELDDGFGFGFAPNFGATASWYFSPMIGLRLHGSYMPSEFPTRDEDAGVTAFGEFGPAVTQVTAFENDDSDYPLNNWFTDLSLTFRPWINNEGNFLASSYLFLGGGVAITDVAGNGNALGLTDGTNCVDRYLAIGACLSHEPDYATVGQGTVGFGFNLLPIAETIGLFGEFAVHGYDSPFHTPDEDDALFTQTLAEDKFAFTPRAALGVKFAFGDLTPAPVVVPVAPAPAPAPPAPPAPPVERPITVCVVEGTALTQVNAVVVEGDTLVAATRQPFTAAYPATAPAYAAGEAWYINNDALMFNEREFVKFGVPRIVPPTQLTYVGEHQGVGLYAETGATAPYQVLYAPLRPGCEFQPYQVREQIRVRG